MDPTSPKALLAETSARNLLKEFPYLENFFDAMRLDVLDDQSTIMDVLSAYPDEYFRDYGTTKLDFAEAILGVVERLEQERSSQLTEVSSITVQGGTDKAGRPELAELTIQKGEVTCIVGPTGSGKSRLLEDIECLAQGDTQTGRRILVNGAVPDDAQRYQLDNRLVAQISQNMNFVVDLSVEEFLNLHAQSRSIDDAGGVIQSILACGNRLAGEPFDADTPVTQLSGGQSRALMIADTALLSTSPIILIDEIENAGIDRKQALELLVRQEKIILLATHDPTLALVGGRRVVIENGGIHDILVTSPQERENLAVLERLDAFLLAQRNLIRNGQRMEGDVRTQVVDLVSQHSAPR